MRTVLRPDADGVDAYSLLTALVVPRPIAWISTVSTDGVGNLAPHSFFGVACAKPPIVSFTSVGHKDTLANVRATGELVVNLAHRDLLDAVNATSAPFEGADDEARALGITMEPSELVRPQRVAASPASLECTLHSMHELGDSVLVLADVVAFTIADGVLEGSHPAMEHLAPLSRLGGDEWGLPPEVLELARPQRPEDALASQRPEDA